MCINAWERNGSDSAGIRQKGPIPHCIALIITQFSPIVCIKFLKIFYFREENQVCTGSNWGFPLESSCFFVMHMVK